MCRRILLPVALFHATLFYPLASPADPMARRAELQALADAQGEAAIPQLARHLDDPHPVVRRTAVRLLLGLGKPAREALVGALANPDPVVRLPALEALCQWADDPLPFVEQALNDENVSLRVMAVRRLAALDPRPENAVALLEKARRDPSTEVSQIANQALWPFRRDVVLIRDRADHDYNVAVVQTIPLPEEGWKFVLDPERDGHTRDYYKPAFADGGWRDFAIGKPWQKQGVEHIGVAWYRRTIALPAAPQHVAVELHFGGVDESAWVWVNGVYVGAHDIGPEGWNKAFALDITKEIVWGADNQITVRAMNTAAMGGIWKPVQIEVLK